MIFLFFFTPLFRSAFVAVSMEVDERAGREENEENEQPSAVSEEKALSDSEIKVPPFCLTQLCV